MAFVFFSAKGTGEASCHDGLQTEQRRSNAGAPPVKIRCPDCHHHRREGPKESIGSPWQRRERRGRGLGRRRAMAWMGRVPGWAEGWRTPSAPRDGRTRPPAAAGGGGGGAAARWRRWPAGRGPPAGGPGEAAAAARDWEERPRSVRFRRRGAVTPPPRGASSSSSSSSGEQGRERSCG